MCLPGVGGSDLPDAREPAKRSRGNVQRCSGSPDALSRTFPSAQPAWLDLRVGPRAAIGAQLHDLRVHSGRSLFEFGDRQPGGLDVLVNE